MAAGHDALRLAVRPRRRSGPSPAVARAACTIAQAIRWVKQSFLPAALSVLAPGVEHVDGEGAEAGGGGDRAALVHEAHQRGRRAADRHDARRPGGAGGARARRCPRRALSTSSLVTRPRGPVPSTESRSTPSALAIASRDRSGVGGAVAGPRVLRSAGRAPSVGCGRRAPRRPPGAPAPAAMRQRTRPDRDRRVRLARGSRRPCPATGRAPRRRPCRWRSPRAGRRRRRRRRPRLPLEHRALGDRIAHLREGDVHELGLGGVRFGGLGLAAARRRRSSPSTSISPSTAPTGDRRVRLGEDLDERAGGGAGTSASTLSVETSTSGSSASPVADLLQPLEDRAFGDRLAHLGHR